MTTITVTSDWKNGDYYLGALRGALYSLSSDIRVVDITNSVPSFDVLQEIFVLRSVFFRFPPSTIHILGVMSEPSAEKPMIVVSYKGHYFIGVNDGRFSLLFDNVPAICFEILKGRDMPFSTFMALDLFAEGVDIILRNEFESRCVASEILREPKKEVVYYNDVIYGRVVYCDSFGNVITNITRALFNSLRNGRGFTIYLQGPYTRLRRIYEGYGDSAPGEIIALFNSLGLLELAVNGGNLVSAEGVEHSAEVTVRFDK
jgi:S-adenosylmethionine hydrolase